VPKILLLIREHGKPDHAEVHPNRDAARTALLRFVQDHWPLDDIRCPSDEEAAIRIFFAQSPKTYVIASVKQGANPDLGRMGEA